MRHILVAVSLLLATLGSMASAAVQVSVGFSVPGLTIGINLPAYPYLVLVPGYPVYYAPRLESNYFFYDGLYWVFVEDNWYVSYWYNGPWEMVYPDYVPLFILRVPVYYYRWPPLYFRSWWRGGPPHWGERWGRDWEHRHTGWNQWDMSTAPAPAPLPDYQREYFGNRYPHRTGKGNCTGSTIATCRRTAWCGSTCLVVKRHECKRTHRPGRSVSRSTCRERRCVTRSRKCHRRMTGANHASAPTAGRLLRPMPNHGNGSRVNVLFPRRLS